MIKRFYRQKLHKLLNRKMDGMLSVELAISPLTILFAVILMLCFIMLIYYALVYLFFAITIMAGAREAAIDPNSAAVEDKIYRVVRDVLPESREGLNLIERNDIQIQAFDGDYVTVRAVYDVMLPGGDLYEWLGGRAEDLIVPAPVLFSYFREY
ncbi:hypothetical protein RB620_24720 [Paenibacillus sp. LHD-117]|uniref:hypothetical protein n=1 Tax=Paenibacillus sp. LHD-117 TaxID=3071412 RepID=UPI0027DF1A37|nr:hypothetical protein [Paenibacillus sp. LHD-117]MDQ6422641.1 hypothetical protein [Paenibacillus sp. LHD-117]